MNKSISEELFKISRNKKIPLTVNFEVTAACNLSCIHCYHDNCRKNTGEELTFGQIKEMFSSLKNAGTMFLIITGGEPFLRQDILEILNLAREMSFSIIIFTI